MATPTPNIAAIEEDRAAVIGRDSQRGRANRPVTRNLKCAAEKAFLGRRGFRGVPFGEPYPIRAGKKFEAGEFFASDPFAVPVMGVKQPHRPMGYAAPRRGFARLIPDPYFPKTVVMRFQMLPSVRDKQRLIRFHFATIPKITLIGIDFFTRAGD